MRKYNIFNFIDKSYNKKILDKFLTYILIMFCLTALTATVINTIQLIKYKKLKHTLKTMELSISNLTNCKAQENILIKTEKEQALCPYKILSRIGNALPECVNLTEFNMKENKFYIKGLAQNYNYIIDFIHNLNELGFNIHKVHDITQLTNGTINFKLNF